MKAIDTTTFQSITRLLHDIQHNCHFDGDAGDKAREILQLLGEAQAQPRDPAQPTGRTYASVDELMKGEGFSMSVVARVQMLALAESLEPEAIRWESTPEWHAERNGGKPFADGEIHITTGKLYDIARLVRLIQGACTADKPPVVPIIQPSERQRREDQLYSVPLPGEITPGPVKLALLFFQGIEPRYLTAQETELKPIQVAPGEGASNFDPQPVCRVPSRHFETRLINDKEIVFPPWRIEGVRGLIYATHVRLCWPSMGGSRDIKLPKPILMNTKEPARIAPGTIRL